MPLRALVLAAGLLWASSGFSQDNSVWVSDGNHLYNECDSSTTDYLFCAGYVSAMSDELQNEGYVCLPTGITRAQTVHVVMKYLRDHPEQRHLVASALIRAALQPAFPCE
jgi:hypothetical protein